MQPGQALPAGYRNSLAGKPLLDRLRKLIQIGTCQAYPVFLVL